MSHEHLQKPSSELPQTPQWIVDVNAIRILHPQVQGGLVQTPNALTSRQHRSATEGIKGIPGRNVALPRLDPSKTRSRVLALARFRADAGGRTWDFVAIIRSG